MRLRWTARAVPFAGAALGFAAAARAQQAYYGHGPGMYGGWHEGWGWGGMILGPLVMILVVAATVVLVVVALRWVGAGHGPAAPGRGPGGRSALDILDERFARGEIDKDEFEERRRVLRG